MTILAELHRDHLNLNRLLDILRAKIDKLHSGTRPNFRLLADAIGYIGDYADRHHHVREERMLAYFSNRDAELDELVQQCGVQHHQLQALSHDLSDAIDSILNDTLMPMDQFIDKLETYVLEQKAHLDFEEKHLFPRLDQVATEADWRTLGGQLPQNLDPLFGEHQSEEYVELYRDLLQDVKR
jgi:hemerythrin-like domain-containing protein